MKSRRLSPAKWSAASVPVLLSLLSGGTFAAAEPSHAIYVTSEASGTVAVTDGGSLQLVRRIEVGDRPHNIEATPDGLLVVATQGADTVSVIDPTADPATIRRIGIGAPPHDLALGTDGRTVFVVSERGLLARLDPASGRILGKVKLGGRPHNLIVWREAAFLTDTATRRIVVLDGETPKGLPISIVGHDLAVRPGSEELWVTPWNSDRAVVVGLKERKEIAGFRVGRTPSHKHLAFTEDGSEAWITEPQSGSLFVVNAQTRKVVATIDLGGHPHHVRFAAGKAYVAVGPTDLVALDVKARSIIGRQAVGSDIHDVALRPAE